MGREIAVDVETSNIGEGPRVEFLAATLVPEAH